MSPLSSRDEFLTELRQALALDRNITDTDARVLSRKLHPVLWEAAKAIKREPTDHPFAKALNAARKDLARAEQVKTHATALLSCLPHPYGDHASSWWFLPGTRDAGLIQEARDVLNKLIQAAVPEAEERRARTRPGPGRRPDLNRRRLSEWVAIQLVNVGVRPTTTDGGTFARVLVAVQCAAGFDGTNIARDVRAALRQPVVVRFIREQRQNSA